MPEVVVTHPQAPLDNLDLYRQIGVTFDRKEEAERLCAEFERAYARATAAKRPPRDVLYLIWRDPWMTVAPRTYISQTLALFDWRTLPAESVVEVPRAGSEETQQHRYPEVDLADFVGQVDRVLLSSEPFHFKAGHVPEVEALVPGAAVSLIDGEMTSWYGSRAIAGLDYLDRQTTEAAT